MDSIERETEITDPEEFKEALILMGYRKAVEVRKVRVKTKYKNYEICLDNVEDLGYFVEVEKIVDTGDSELIQNELLEFLKTLGLNISERVFNGYDTLIYIKNKN
jgi:adenylate cyclase class 2